MKAYMSYRADEQDRERRWVDPVACWASLFELERDADAAVAEARRILADVAPTISRPALDDERRFVPGDHVFREALAEALAAFVAEEEWYWYCFPGCLPDSEPFGPFETETEALADAREGVE